MCLEGSQGLKNFPDERKKKRRLGEITQWWRLLFCPGWITTGKQGISGDASRHGFQIGGLQNSHGEQEMSWTLLPSPGCAQDSHWLSTIPCKNVPFTPQSSNLERFHILCWKGKGPSRPFSEVSCCYGCICLLNIMMVLQGVMPLWLSFLKTKAQF